MVQNCFKQIWNKMYQISYPVMPWNMYYTIHAEYEFCWGIKLLFSTGKLDHENFIFKYLVGPREKKNYKHTKKVKITTIMNSNENSKQKVPNEMAQSEAKTHHMNE